MRSCGDCQLCCKLVPVAELGKPGFRRCVHQRHGKGCTIYERRPFSCRNWDCHWLSGGDCDELTRPDRSGLVINMDLDYVHARDDATGETHTLPVIEVWMDPARPNAHRDPAFRAWLDRMGRERGLQALIRTSPDSGFVLVPPSRNATGEWFEKHGMQGEEEHSMADRIRTLEKLA